MTSTLTLTAVLRGSALDSRRGIVRMERATAAALGLQVWDPVLITGGRTTAALVGFCDPGSGGDVLLCDDLVLGNLRVQTGTTVTVTPATARTASTVTLAGPAEITALVDPAMLRQALLGKAVTSGDNVSLLPQDLSLPAGTDPASRDAARRAVQHAVGPAWTTLLLTVTASEPTPGALVTLETSVGWRGGPATLGTSPATVRAPGLPVTGGVPLADLPGLEGPANALREMLEVGFHGTELLRRLGATAQMGVLLTGPAGSGTTELVHSVATAVGARVVSVWAPQLAAAEPDAGARALQQALPAPGSAPSVLLIEDVEALAPRGERSALLPTLLKVVTAASTQAGVAVVATTAHPEKVDPVLLRPDALTRELAVPLPDKTVRRRLLEVACRAVPLADDVDLDAVAGRTPGYVRADVQALVREAAVRAAHRQRAGDHSTATVAAVDLDAALEVVRPSALGDAGVDVGSLTLDDVGDMVETKRELTEAVLWPLTYPDTFTRMGIAPPRGVLLYGPPGCGKTFLVRALAASGQTNLLAVKGAEVLSKWVGESEQAVRALFRRARDAAPTLIFLDEIDALAPSRGQSSDAGTTDRVVAALLTELDGVDQLRDVVVIGATNRPDLLDPAMLRPGRLGRLVYVPPPDAGARRMILQAAAQGVPLADGVDLTVLAARTERFSAADCAELLRESAMTAMRESMSSPLVTADHVEHALTVVRPSLDPAQLADLQGFADRQRA